MSIGERIGRRVREKRESLELSLWRFAQEAGVDPGHLGKLERGEIENPGAELLEKVLPAAGLTFDQFLVDETPMAGAAN